MVAYLEEALKIKIGFESQEQVTKLFSMCSISKVKQGNNLEEKMAKSWKGATLPLAVAPSLLSLVGFCRHNSEDMTPRFYPTVAGFKTYNSNMEEDLRHVQQALEGLEQQLSCLAKGVKDLKREKETILEQSSKRNLGRHRMHDNQWGYGNFSAHARSYEHNSYNCYESNRLGARDCYNDKSCKGVSRNIVRNGGNYVNIDERFHKRRDDYEGYYDSYNYGGYTYREVLKRWKLHQGLLVTTI
ncbi:hypothetical protein M9H77_03986 [Catharanthus roseus]|uniref:Uncharacterized protein n=1 Tax=Catharanthus roseus TaxID=4058 RepID=A0ACC0CD75_CATRO|nr:hypothetical protein M9H77_03986 [Catharanthus roseus]